jgi:hypothetical protein
MKKTIIWLFTSLLSVSCSDKGTTYPSNSTLENTTTGVRTKITYPTLESNQILSVEDFEYNSSNRLQKRIYYGGNRKIIYEYDEYIYDGNGLLTKKLNYHSNIYSSSGFILLISTSYIYSNGLIISEQDTFPQAGYSEEYKYEYSSGQFLSKSFYRNGIIMNKTIYTYKYGRLQNESLCDTTGRYCSSTEYIYQSNYLFESRQYASNGDLLKKTNYSYNENRKLSIENVQVIAIYSSSNSYVVRYQY